VVDEQRPFAGLVGEDRRGGEMRVGLVAGEGPLERRGPGAHPLEIAGLLAVCRLVRREQGGELVARRHYSY